MAGYYIVRMDMPNGNRSNTRVSPEEMLRDDEVIGISDWESQACQEFKDAPIGAVALVREGDKAIALVKLMSTFFTDYILMNKYGMALYRHIEILTWVDDNHQPRPNLFKTTGAFRHLTSPNLEQYNYIDNLYKSYI